MGRILFWVLLGFVAYVAWRWWNAKQQLSERGEEGTPKQVTDERMVPCAICGLNVPQSEAVSGDGHWYCSDEHRRRAQA